MRKSVTRKVRILTHLHEYLNFVIIQCCTVRQQNQVSKTIVLPKF